MEGEEGLVTPRHPDWSDSDTSEADVLHPWRGDEPPDPANYDPVYDAVVRRAFTAWRVGKRARVLERRRIARAKAKAKAAAKEAARPSVLLLAALRRMQGEPQ